MDDDQPLKAAGGYNINWDEIGEGTDPFAKQSALEQDNFNRTPHVGSKGDEPVKSTNVSPKKPPLKGGPVKNSPDRDKSRNGIPAPDSALIEASGDPVEDLSESGPRMGPPPEALTKALEHVAVTQKRPDNPEPTNGNDPFQLEVENEPPALTRIDSSTRPASPSRTAILNPQSNAEQVGVYDNGVDRDQVADLLRERNELVTTVDEMRRCIAEYERSLQHLVEEKTQSQQHVTTSVSDLVAERDQAIEEVATIEKAFGDLHRRFEKSKQVIEGYKKNEEALKRSIDEYKSLLERQEQKYLNLKRHAEEKLAKVAQDTENSRNEFQAHMTQLQASLRISQLQIQNLETQLQQKVLENQELTKICDELLDKYGSLT